MKVIIVSHNHVDGYETGEPYSLDDLRCLLPLGSVWDLELMWGNQLLSRDNYPQIFKKINEKAPDVSGIGIPEGWAVPYTTIHIIKKRLKNEHQRTDY